jgi:hypothetical protein
VIGPVFGGSTALIVTGAPLLAAGLADPVPLEEHPAARTPAAIRTGST